MTNVIPGTILCLQGKQRKEAKQKMSEKEKKIVEKLKEAIPKMSEFDKGYILGKVESFSEKEDEEADKKESS